MDAIYNSAGSVNGFDQYGHFLRAELLVTNCVDYVTTTLSGCEANFQQLTGSKDKAAQAQARAQYTQAEAQARAHPSIGALKTLLDFAVGRPSAGGRAGDRHQAAAGSGPGEPAYGRRGGAR
jgi:hypothetical protein